MSISKKYSIGNLKILILVLVSEATICLVYPLPVGMIPESLGPLTHCHTGWKTLQVQVNIYLFNIHLLSDTYSKSNIFPSVLAHTQKELRIKNENILVSLHDRHLHLQRHGQKRAGISENVNKRSHNIEKKTQNLITNRKNHYLWQRKKEIIFTYVYVYLLRGVCMCVYTIAII